MPHRALFRVFLLLTLSIAIVVGSQIVRADSGVIPESQALLDAENPHDAIALLSRALRSNELSRDETLEALKLRVIAYERVGALEQAMDDAETLIEQFPDSAEGYSLRMGLYFVSGATEEAMGELDRLIEMEPENAKWMANRAGILLSLGDLDSALRDAERALAIDPDYANAYKIAGVAYRQRNEIEKALTMLDAGIALDPEDEELWQVRGVVRLLVGDLTGSISDSLNAITLDPHNGSAFETLALATWASGDPDEALTIIESALSFQKSNAETQYFFLALLVSTQRYAEAAAFGSDHLLIAGSSDRNIFLAYMATRLMGGNATPLFQKSMEQRADAENMSDHLTLMLLLETDKFSPAREQIYGLIEGNTDINVVCQLSFLVGMAAMVSGHEQEAQDLFLNTEDLGYAPVPGCLASSEQLDRSPDPNIRHRHDNNDEA